VLCSAVIGMSIINSFVPVRMHNNGLMHPHLYSFIVILIVRPAMMRISNNTGAIFVISIELAWWWFIHTNRSLSIVNLVNGVVQLKMLDTILECKRERKRFGIN
jgi:hypothetical protein